MRRVEVLIGLLVLLIAMPVFAEQAVEQGLSLKQQLKAVLTPGDALLRQYMKSDTDPTRLSPRFSEAMQGVTRGGQGAAQAGQKQDKLPTFKLMAFLERKNQPPSAMIEVGETPYLVREKMKFSVASATGNTVLVMVSKVQGGEVQLYYGKQLLVLR